MLWPRRACGPWFGSLSSTASSSDDGPSDDTSLPESVKWSVVGCLGSPSSSSTEGSSEKTESGESSEAEES